MIGVIGVGVEGSGGGGEKTSRDRVRWGGVGVSAQAGTVWVLVRVVTSRRYRYGVIVCWISLSFDF